jgi:hypothetical protein
MDRVISVSSMAFDGYPLETALDELAGLGVRYVEPASVDKVFQHLTEEDFCDARAAWLRDQMAARGLACVSLSAHMDLSQPDSVDRFRRRLEFAQASGAGIVNTIAGPTSGLAGFRDDFAVEIEDLRKAIKDAKMPKPAMEAAVKELSRLEKMMPYSPESTVSRTYLDWMIHLPWAKRTRSATPARCAQRTLAATSRGSISIPTPRAPKSRAAVITIRPSPEPRS